MGRGRFPRLSSMTTRAAGVDADRRRVCSQRSERALSLFVLAKRVRDGDASRVRVVILPPSLVLLLLPAPLHPKLEPGIRTDGGRCARISHHQFLIRKQVGAFVPAFWREVVNSL